MNALRSCNLLRPDLLDSDSVDVGAHRSRFGYDHDGPGLTGPYYISSSIEVDPTRGRSSARS